MKPRKHARSWVVLASTAVITAMAVAAVPGARDEEQDSKRPFCCVANPRYAGICSVDLGSGETCADVLAYLNNAASGGKTYCGNTPIRGGWKQVECQEDSD